MLFTDLRTKSEFCLKRTLTHWFCITEVESAYCAVRTESYIKHTSSLKGYKRRQTQLQFIEKQYIVFNVLQVSAPISHLKALYNKTRNVYKRNNEVLSNNHCCREKS
jgi:hypothetical protein